MAQVTGEEATRAKEPNGFLTSSPCVAERQNRACVGGRRHAALQDKRGTEQAQTHPAEICAVTCRRLKHQKQTNSRGLFTICEFNLVNEGEAGVAMKGPDALQEGEGGCRRVTM